jgi:site-specific DNA recombinase
LVLQRAKDLTVKWPDLPTTERRKFIRAVVKTVTLGRKSLWIEVDKVKMGGMLTGNSPDESRSSNNRKPDVINLTADFQPVRRGVELKVHTPDDHSNTSGPVPSLVKAVARGRTWYAELISGEASSVEELARRAGFKCRYVRKILQCAVLSPDISEAILSGRQARHLTVKNLQSGLPLDWHQQARDLLVTS